MLLVTGHRGFLGSAVVRRLVAAGRPFRTPTGDVRDRAALRTAMAGCSAVVHLAYRHEDRDGDGLRGNVDGARAVAEVAAELGVARIVGSSTAGVWGHGEHRGTDERAAERPDTPHARSRAEADRLLLGGAVSAVVVRPRFVLGDGDRQVGPRLARLPVLPDGGRARWSVIDVDALAEVFLGLVDTPSPPILIAAEPEPVTVAELVLRYRGSCPPSLSSRLLPGPLRRWPRVAFLLRDQVFSSSRLWATLSR